MTGWTRWRLLAKGEEWSDAALDWDGPSCYELALSHPRDDRVLPVYVGETNNERRRLSAYARHGSHLHAEINQALRRGYRLHFRARATATKNEAVMLQNARLAARAYDWNICLNLWCK